MDKIVAKVNEDRRARMVEEFGIDSIVSVKTATADAIMSYVRARKNSQASANIETMYQLVDDKVEALEFIIKSATEYTGIPLKDLALKPNNLIVCIGRKGRSFCRVEKTVLKSVTVWLLLRWRSTLKISGI